MKLLKLLVWIYFALLITEGALRKWILPHFSDALLIARDPVVLLLYAQAFRLGKFPKNGWLIAIALLCFAALLVSFLAEVVNPWVIGFGLRADFLHLPLIFVLPGIFDFDDVKRVGAAFLVLALPMALLMVLQFRAGPRDWLNAGAGGGGQLPSALGRIRPAATFSFISGPVFFFAGVTAFVLVSQLGRGEYPLWLCAVAGGSTLVACAVSGSRSMLGMVAMVGMALMTGLLLYPRALGGALRLVLVIGVVFVLVSSTKTFRQGHEVLSARIGTAAEGEGGLRGFIQRFSLGFRAPIDKMFDVPLFGKGLGLGTNGGAALLGVRNQFLLAEEEWDRLLSESGPIIGTAFILLRVLLAFYLLLTAATSARRGNLLPLLLLSAAGTGIVNGQWGQPTTQGFTTLFAGLCLAAVPGPSTQSAGALDGRSPSSFDLANSGRLIEEIRGLRQGPRQGLALPSPRFAVRDGAPYMR